MRHKPYSTQFMQVLQRYLAYCLQDGDGGTEVTNMKDRQFQIDEAIVACAVCYAFATCLAVIVCLTRAL